MTNPLPPALDYQPVNNAYDHNYTPEQMVAHLLDFPGWICDAYVSAEVRKGVSLSICEDAYALIVAGNATVKDAGGCRTCSIADACNARNVRNARDARDAAKHMYLMARAHHEYLCNMFRAAQVLAVRADMPAPSASHGGELPPSWLNPSEYGYF